MGGGPTADKPTVNLDTSVDGFRKELRTTGAPLAEPSAPSQGVGRPKYPREGILLTHFIVSRDVDRSRRFYNAIRCRAGSAGNMPRCWVLRWAHMDRLGAVVANGTNWRGSVARIAEEVLSSRGVDFALAVPARGWTNATWLASDLVVRVAPSAGPADLLREAGLAACLPVQVGYPEIIDAGVLHGHEWVLTRRLLGQNLSDVWSELD